VGTLVSGDTLLHAILVYLLMALLHLDFLPSSTGIGIDVLSLSGQVDGDNDYSD
jgi:hypothetical protein